MTDDSNELKEIKRDNDNDRNDEDITIETPLINSNNENAPEITLVANQAGDSEEQAEVSSLLVRETNLDEIETFQPETELSKQETSIVSNISLKSIASCIAVGLVLLFLLFVLVIGLPACIASLNYDEYALLRNKLTGSVNDQYVYEQGLSFVFPFSEWIKFTKTVHTIRINNLAIFTTDKLQVNATFVIFYFLKKENIGALYRKLGTDYHKLILSVCRSELQILGQVYSIDDYRLKRIDIKRKLKINISKRLFNDYGFDLHDLLMHQLKFSNRVNSINLRRMIVGIRNEEAFYDKKYNMVKQDTEYQTKLLKNKALLERKTAELISNNTILKIDQINYNTKLELVNSEGLTKNLKGLDFFNSSTNDIQKKKLSFCWVSSLVNHENLVIFNKESESISNILPNRLSDLFVQHLNY